jgi:hypothetical protein
MTSLAGGCLCGKIRYEITEEPKGAAICHCRSCQKATGGTNFPVLVVHKDDLKVIAGEPATYSSPGGSGQMVHRRFCTTCGSTILGHPEVMDELRTVSAVTLDKPEDVTIGMEVWTQDAQAWDCVLDKTAKFDQNPTS